MSRQVSSSKRRALSKTDPDLVWKALADPTRRRILDLLRAEPQTTGAIAGEFDTTRFAVMKHLAMLVECGLVTVRRVGRERWNHLNAVPLQRIVERWVRPFEAQAASGLLNLAAELEKRERNRS